MSFSMSTFAELSYDTFLLCLIFGFVEFFMKMSDKKEWGTHLPDFLLLMAVWTGYVWLSNLFSSRIIHVDEYDIINLLAIALVCVYVPLFGGRNDNSFHP